MPSKKIISIIVIITASCATLASIVFFSLLPMRIELIRKECSTENTICLYALRYHYLFSDKMSLTVSRYVAQGLPDYGHYVQYPFGYSTTDEGENKQIQQATIEFSPEGITYTHPTQHRVFIPQSAYLNTR